MWNKEIVNKANFGIAILYYIKESFMNEISFLLYFCKEWIVDSRLLKNPVVFKV